MFGAEIDAVQMIQDMGVIIVLIMIAFIALFVWFVLRELGKSEKNVVEEIRDVKEEMSIIRTADKEEHEHLREKQGELFGKLDDVNVEIAKMQGGFEAWKEIIKDKIT